MTGSDVHSTKLPARRQLPSVDKVLRHPTGRKALKAFGHTAFVKHVRQALDEIRTSDTPEDETERCSEASVAAQAARNLERGQAPSLRRVFNLTGTVLHTNLGRAPLAKTAIERAVAVMRQPSNLEFDVSSGKRGERDDHVRHLICDLTGADDAIVVNNNAAAVVLVLNSLAREQGVVVSRGELIEIGGSFRIPDMMAQAGAKLVEVGTTNRTHLKDYQSAIDDNVALMMKVHTSNYVIKGFTKEVSAPELAALAAQKGLALVDDLGSGTLVDLSEYGLKRERTVRDALDDGASLVTFSGDKLLGGPQAGFVVGRRDLVRACAKNPLKRAMRLDKMRMAALEATLKLYQTPEHLVRELPTLRFLARPLAEIVDLAARLAPIVQKAVGQAFVVEPCDTQSQIGSGALPLDTVASAGLALRPRNTQTAGRQLQALAEALRALPVPVIGHIRDGALILDLRTLDDELTFVEQLNDGQNRLQSVTEATQLS